MKQPVFFCQGRRSEDAPFLWSSGEVTNGLPRRELFRQLSLTRNWRELARSADDLVRLSCALEWINSLILGIRVVTATLDDAGRPLLLEGVVEAGVRGPPSPEALASFLKATWEAMSAAQRHVAIDNRRFEQALDEIHSQLPTMVWPRRTDLIQWAIRSVRSGNR